MTIKHLIELFMKDTLQKDRQYLFSYINHLLGVLK